MERNEMHTASDTGLLQLTNKFIATDPQTIQIQLNDIQMPGVLNMRSSWRAHDLRKILETFLIQSSIPFTPFPKPLTLLHLGQTKRCSNISQVVLKTRREDFVVPRTLRRVAVPSIPAETVQTHHPHTSGPLSVISGNHSAFASGDILCRVE